MHLSDKKRSECEALVTDGAPLAPEEEKTLKPL